MNKFTDILQIDAKNIKGFLLELDKNGILTEQLPELTALKGVESEGGMSHKDNFKHTLQVVENTYHATTGPLLRLVAILHDIGKAKTKTLGENGWSFHNHEFVGSKMLRKIFNRLHIDKNDLKYVSLLIAEHGLPKELCDSNISDSAIRRFSKKLGKNLEDLILFCKCDITTKFDWKRIKQQNNMDELLVRINKLKEDDLKAEWRSPITGDVIMRHYGKIDGKDIGKIKSLVEKAIKSDVIPDSYDAAFEYMLKLDIVQNETITLNRSQLLDFKEDAEKGQGYYNTCDEILDLLNIKIEH